MYEHHYIDSYGVQRWLADGVLHRENGPAVIHSNGTQFWYSRGQRHREDGPAAIYYNGAEEWYRFDLLHREDGPAVIFKTGDVKWYLEDTQVNRQFFQKYTGLTDEEMFILVLKYGDFK